GLIQIGIFEKTFRKLLLKQLFYLSKCALSVLQIYLQSRQAYISRIIKNKRRFDHLAQGVGMEILHYPCNPGFFVKNSDGNTYCLLGILYPHLAEQGLIDQYMAKEGISFQNVSTGKQLHVKRLQISWVCWPHHHGIACIAI